MPHEWNNRIVVTKEELIPDFFPTWEALKKKLTRDAKKPYGIKRARIAGGYGNELLIDFDTLPPYIRKQLGDPRKKDCSLERYFWEDKDAVSFFQKHKAGKYGYIEVEKQQKYVLDASVIKAAIRWKDAHRIQCMETNRAPKNTDKLVSEAVNTFNYWRKIKNLTQHNLPENHIRLRDKIRRFEDGGYETLLKGYDNQNAQKKTERIMMLLNAMFTQKEKPTQTEVVRMYDAFLNGMVEVINPETGEMYDPKDYSKLSPRTITSFLASWIERVATHLARSGNRQKYMNKYEPFQTLGRPAFAGSIISIDDRQPPFWYEEGKRIWFYNAIDLASECIIASVWGKEKEGIILDFYVQLVRNMAEWGMNMPAELECESSLNSSFKETFLREGGLFKYVRILANRAHSKKIERYYGTIRNTIENKRPGWIGRPHVKDEALQARPGKQIIIPYDQLARDCLQDIQNWNNSEHSIVKGKSRWEVFIEMQNPDLKTINWHAILPYLGEQTKTTCRVGNLKFNNTFHLIGEEGYILTGETLLNVMDVIEGKQVDICFIRNSRGGVLKALVYYNNRCICEAITKPVPQRARIEQTKEDVEMIGLVEHYNNTVRGYARRHKNEIEKLVIQDNRSKVLNNKFVMPGMETIETITRDACEEYKESDDCEETDDILDASIFKIDPIEKPLERIKLKDRY